MSGSEKSIVDKTAFDLVRYAQLWEDADVLVAAMGEGPGRRFLSIASAGDNALALLLLDPEEVVAADLSRAQIDCLKLRMAAYRALEHDEFLELLGVTDSDRRGKLMERVSRCLPVGTIFSNEQVLAATLRHGAANIGKFERYFRLFRRYVLPLIHGRGTVEDVFKPRSPAERLNFFETRWNTWRWRLATTLFFSKFTMGRLGRDPAFFDQVSGSASAHVRAKVRFAAVEQDPSRNPYMQCVLIGRQTTALPLAWRAESFDVIKSRLDRVRCFQGPIESADTGKFDGFNLSDVFEYMTPDQAARAYERLLDKSHPGARLVYWNMMAPRRAPARFANSVTRLKQLEDDLKASDKAFFYRDLVIEEVVG